MSIRPVMISAIYFALLSVTNVLLVVLLDPGTFTYITIVSSLAMLMPLIFRRPIVYVAWGAVFILISAYFLMAISMMIAQKGNPNHFNTIGTIGLEMLFLLALVCSVSIFYAGYSGVSKRLSL